MSKGKSIKKKILESLKEKAKLNDNPGELIQSNKEIYSKKDRRNSGRVYPNSFYKSLAKKSCQFIGDMKIGRASCRERV